MNIITSNNGKYREYKKIFPDAKMLDIGYHEIQADTLEEVVEDALDGLKENAPLMIDDSGLFIDALHGFPGVYSSYVMRTLGCEGILKLMDGTDNRDARFECVIGYVDIDGNSKVIKGEISGCITESMKGTSGFGYDPVFMPKSYRKTFAEMTAEEKNKISHRGKAMERLVRYLDFSL